MKSEQAAATIAHGDPFAIFTAWYDEARITELNDANAMALATATPDGAASLRMVLLKRQPPTALFSIPIRTAARAQN